MPSPFPGMDPYLEHPGLWPDVHQSLVTYARDALQGQVGRAFYVSIGERVYLEEAGREVMPDVAVVRARGRGYVPGASPLEPDTPLVVALEEDEAQAPAERREPFLEVRDAYGGHRVVTVIEVVSPSNKRGPGRALYLQKQAEVLATDASLVEVDLIRAGPPVVACPPDRLGDEPWRVVVTRGSRRTRRELYPVGYRDRLPRVRVPLRRDDADVVLDLPAVLALAYERGAYDRRVDYRGDPPPPDLPRTDLAWARGLAAEHEARRAAEEADEE